MSYIIEKALQTIQGEEYLIDLWYPEWFVMDNYEYLVDTKITVRFPHYFLVEPVEPPKPGLMAPKGRSIILSGEKGKFIDKRLIIGPSTQFVFHSKTSDIIELRAC